MTVGIRELKANLSWYLKKVRAGATLHISDRGRTIATVQPAMPKADIAWVHQMVAEGKAQWSGARSLGATRPVRLRPGSKTASDLVLEGRD